MAEYKKQHYVPRFYLKNFSTGNKTLINLYNLKRNLDIKSAKLYNQCQENYFYGDNLNIEKSLGGIEKHAASVIREIIEYSTPPERLSENHHILSAFWVIQNGRTKFASESSNDMMDKLIKALMRKEGNVEDDEYNKFKIEMTNPIALPLSVSAQAIPIVFDLSFKLLINKTNIPFITSDNPVVLYNQYMEPSNYGSHTGLSSQGLQVFIPLSPKHLILLYDHNVYQVGSNKHQCCEVLSIKEIDKINELQWHNALENIYYSDFTSSQYIQTQATNFHTYKTRELSNLNEYETVQKEPGTVRTLLHMFKTDIRIGLKPSYINIRKSKSKIHPIDRRSDPRNPLLLKLSEEFAEEVNKGRYKSSDFRDFVKVKANEQNGDAGLR